MDHFRPFLALTAFIINAHCVQTCQLRTKSLAFRAAPLRFLYFTANCNINCSSQVFLQVKQMLALFE